MHGSQTDILTERDWNTVDGIVDADMVWTTLNGRGRPNSATSDRMMGYGPVALHVGGTGEVRFRDSRSSAACGNARRLVGVKDLNAKTAPTAQAAAPYRCRRPSGLCHRDF